MDEDKKNETPASTDAPTEAPPAPEERELSPAEKAEHEVRSITADTHGDITPKAEAPPKGLSNADQQKWFADQERKRNEHPDAPQPGETLVRECPGCHKLKMTADPTGQTKCRACLGIDGTGKKIVDADQNPIARTQLPPGNPSAGAPPAEGTARLTEPLSTRLDAPESLSASFEPSTGR